MGFSMLISDDTWLVMIHNTPKPTSRAWCTLVLERMNILESFFLARSSSWILGRWERTAFCLKIGTVSFWLRTACLLILHVSSRTLSLPSCHLELLSWWLRLEYRMGAVLFNMNLKDKTCDASYSHWCQDRAQSNVEISFRDSKCWTRQSAAVEIKGNRPSVARHVICTAEL